MQVPMQFTIMRDSHAMERAVVDLAKACEDEIARADRPTDAFPLRAIVPIFVVHKDHLEGWKDRVAPALWPSLAILTGRCFVCPAEEEGLQNEYYALDQNALAEFRQGLPVLKIVSAIKHDQILNGRTKHVSEKKIRKALGFAVFTRDIVIGELLAGQARLLNKIPVAMAREAGLEFLRENAWVEGVPSKGDAKDGKLQESDQQIALFASLRREGETLAPKFVPTAASPGDVEQGIRDQVHCWASVARTAQDYDEALLNATRRVKLLMRACVHITALSKEKRKLAKAAKRASERAERRAQKAVQLELDLKTGIHKRPRWRELDPIADPMTKYQHAYFSQCKFSPFEMMLIAFTADVDPNLISTAHALATPEFILARMLRQLYSRQRPRPEFSELPLLHELLFDANDRPHFCQDTRAFLTKAALDLAPRERWAAWFDNPSEPLLLPVKK